MRGLKILGALIALAGVLVHGAMAVASDGASEAAIRQVLNDQVVAWNRGDIETFMRGYKDSPETTFIGKSIEHGYAMILARYKKSYSSKAAMGTLDFSDISVRDLGADYAVATGRFHLARSGEGGGDAGGVFSLIWERTSSGWKIILDHTTSS